MKENSLLSSYYHSHTIFLYFSLSHVIPTHPYIFVNHETFKERLQKLIHKRKTKKWEAKIMESTNMEEVFRIQR